MTRPSILVTAMAAAFVALIGVSQAVKSAEVGEPVAVALVCSDKRSVEEHLALIEADVTYGLVRNRVQEDLTSGKCVRTPGMVLSVQEKGRSVRLVDSDGDNMEITVVRVGDGIWTLFGRIVGKES